MKRKGFSLITIILIFSSLVFASAYENYVTEGVNQAFSNFTEDYLLKQATTVENNYLTSTLTITCNGKTQEKKVAVLFDQPEEISSSIAKQIQYDIVTFFDSKRPVLDYIWKNRVSSISFGDNKIKVGECYNLDNGQGVLVIKSVNDKVVQMDSFFTKEPVVGLGLTKRSHVFSMGLNGGYKAAFLELTSKTRFYPWSYYFQVGYLYSGIYFVGLGLQMELALNNIFDSNFTMLKNASLAAYTNLGAKYTTEVGSCISYGVWYEHRFMKNLAYRIRWDNINLTNNYGVALVISF